MEESLDAAPLAGVALSPTTESQHLLRPGGGGRYGLRCLPARDSPELLFPVNSLISLLFDPQIPLLPADCRPYASWRLGAFA